MAKRGFAAMDPAKVREIAGKGGRAAHAAGTAHRFTAETGSVAGKKGGRGKWKSRPTVVPGIAPASSGTGSIEVYADDEGPATERAPQVYPVEIAS